MTPNPNHSPSRKRVERYPGALRRYFRENPFEKRKVFYTLLAICSATLMLGIWTLTRSDRPYSHGPVADVHASFDANCEACHRPQSIGSVGLSAFDPQSRWLDLTCQKCHGGPDHHREAKWPSDWPGGGTNDEPDRTTDAQCAACHHDHNGKDFSLVRLDDANCTKCHADLVKYHRTPEVLQSPTPRFATGITKFHDPKGGHPEFKKLDAEKSKPHERGLRFSHTHHMSIGIEYVTKQRGKMTKADLLNYNKDNPQIVSRYEFEDTDQGKELVKLECASCHQFDGGHAGAPRLLDGRLGAGKTPLDGFLSGDPKESILPPRGDGAYFLPINFEAHCQACHPLKSPDQRTMTDKAFAPFDLPHRKQPKDLAGVLRARYSALVLGTDGKPELMAKDVADPEVLTVRGEIGDAVRKAMSRVLSDVSRETPNAVSGATCTQCHKLDGNPANVEDLTIRPPAIPTVWFEHSKFNHKSHRGYSCMDCHPNTAPAPLGKATFSADAIYTGPDQKINIEGIASCRKCHTPTFTKEDGQQFGGVRSNCTDCHRYHNGDNPFQGLGAAARDPHPPKMKQP